MMTQEAILYYADHPADFVEDLLPIVSDDSHMIIHHMPRTALADTLFFGVFPFPRSSTVPATSGRLLMIDATSTSIYLFLYYHYFRFLSTVRFDNL